MDTTVQTSKAALWVAKHSKKIGDGSLSKPVKIMMSIFLGGLALVLVAVVFYSIRKHGMQLAKLKHERDVAKQQKKRKEITLQVAELTEEIKKTLIEIADLEEKDAELLTKEIELSDILDLERKKIDALESWKEIDDYLADNPDFESRLRGSAEGQTD